MHVQLAAQGFLQVYGHPMLHQKERVYRDFLTDLDQQLGSSSGTQAIRIANLPAALSVIAEWETELSASTPENTQLLSFIQEQWARRQKGRKQQKVIAMQFHDRILEKISNSPAFVYASLLPTVPFFEDEYKVKKFSIAEE